VRARRADRELREVGLDLIAPSDQHVMGVQIVSQRRPRSVISEPHRGQPRTVPARPRLAGALPIDLTAQQEPPDPVPGARQVHANVLAAAHQVAQLLTLHRRDRHQRQLAGCQQPSQPDRVTLIGLDPVRRRTLGLPRRAHPELEPLRQSPPRQPIASRTSLIDHPRRPRDRTKPRQKLMRTTHNPLRGHLTRRLIKHRERRLASVHVQADPADTVGHVGTSS
jgi:hypothetical protein